MPAPEDEKTNRRKYLISMIRFLIFLAFLVLAGCATGNYGYLKRSPDVTQAFETNQVQPDLTFYYYHYF
mgnify:CR=1 FL=1